MTGLELILVVVFTILALIHAVWAFGVWVPISDEARLVRAVVGADGATRMPGPIPCALVALALIVVAGLIALQPMIWRDVLLALAGGVFVLRGILAWVPIWRKMTPVEPFATLDRYAYGPLCLCLGGGLWWILIA